MDVVATERRAHVEQEVMAQHLTGGGGDGGEDRRIDLERLLPNREFPRRRLERIGADIADRAGGLGGGEEFVLVEEAQSRMTPADERLEPGDGAILETHDRPEQDRDLAALERAANVVLERLPVGAMEAHGRGENLDPVAAGPLGVRERKPGVGEKIAALAVQLRIVVGGADGNGQRDLPLAEADRGGERRAQGVDPGGRVQRIRFGEHDPAESVAAQASERIAWAKIPRQTPRHRQQSGIANRQPVGIVDRLEFVDVDHHHRRRRPPGLLGQKDRRAQAIVEQFAVGQASEIVVNRVVEHPLLGAFELGHVGQRADHPDHLAVGADDRPGLEHVPEIMAVRSAQP